MTKARKKDTDPHGISASMRFVNEVAELNLDAISPRGEVARIIREARRISKKLRKGGKG